MPVSVPKVNKSRDAAAIIWRTSQAAWEGRLGGGVLRTCRPRRWTWTGWQIYFTGRLVGFVPNRTLIIFKTIVMASMIISAPVYLYPAPFHTSNGGPGPLALDGRREEGRVEGARPSQQANVGPHTPGGVGRLGTRAGTHCRALVTPSRSVTCVGLCCRWYYRASAAVCILASVAVGITLEPRPPLNLNRD